MQYLWSKPADVYCNAIYEEVTISIKYGVSPRLSGPVFAGSLKCSHSTCTDCANNDCPLVKEILQDIKP